MSEYVWAVTVFGESRWLPGFVESIGDDPYVVYDVKALEMSLGAVWNLALKENLQKYRTIIISNDDIKATPQAGYWFDKALTEIGPLTPSETLIVTAYNLNQEPDQGRMWMDFTFQGVDFSCFAVNQRLIDTVGFFDERFMPCLYEDTDMVIRLAKAKYSVARVVPMWHHGGGSWDDKEAQQEAMKLNWDRLVEKWGEDTLKELHWSK